MGIVCTLVAISDDNIERVHGDPPLIWRFLNPDEPELYLSEIGAGARPGFLGRLLGRKEVPVPEPLPDFASQPGEQEEVDIDKSWDGIAFCLKRLVDPGVPDIFASGETVGHVEIGYGPAMTFDSTRVAEIATALEPLDSEQLLAVFEPETMGKVYPKGMWSRKEDWQAEYLTEHFAVLRAFVVRLRDASLGVCVCYL